MLPHTSSHSPLADIETIILCGGLGTRLSPVIGQQTPKCLAPIGNRTFLDILINSLQQQGIRRIILSIGHLRELIKNHVRTQPYAQCVDFAEEEKPCGTGGGLKKALQMTSASTLLVMNGDTFCDVNVATFLETHRNHKRLLTIALHHIDAIQPNTTITPASLNDQEQIVAMTTYERGVGFTENRALISAGMYYMEREILAHMPDQESFSLEHDLFPKIIQSNQCTGHIHTGQFIDIGTPATYQQALAMFG